MRRFLILAVGATLVLGLSALPASATVHEIVGQWCSGHDPLAPPGISGGSNADNFAQPLVANGFVGEPVPFEDGLLIPFNYDHPAAKVRAPASTLWCRLPAAPQRSISKESNPIRIIRSRTARG